MRGFILILLILVIPSTIPAQTEPEQIDQTSVAIGGIEVSNGYWIIVETRVIIDANSDYYQNLIFMDFDGNVIFENQIYKTDYPTGVSGIHEYGNRDLLILLREYELGIVPYRDIMIRVSSEGIGLYTNVGDTLIAGELKITAINPNQPKLIRLFRGQAEIYSLSEELGTDLDGIVPSGGRVIPEIQAIDIVGNETHYSLLSYFDAFQIPSSIKVETFEIADKNNYEIFETHVNGTPRTLIETFLGFVVFGETQSANASYLFRFPNPFNTEPVLIPDDEDIAEGKFVIASDYGLLVFGETTFDSYYFQLVDFNGIPSSPIFTASRAEIATTAEFKRDLYVTVVKAQGGALALGIKEDEALITKVDAAGAKEWDTYFNGDPTLTTSERTRIPYFFPILPIPIIAKLTKKLTYKKS